GPRSAVPSRALVRVLSVTELIRGAFESQDEALGEQLVTLEPGHGRRIVGGGTRKGLPGQTPTGVGRQGPAVRSQLVEHVVVLVRAGDHTNPGVVLGCGTNHRGAADVDGLDAGGGEERVEVADHEVEGLDALRVEIGSVDRVGEIGEETAMDTRVECLDAPIEHLGCTGDGLHGDDRDAGLHQRRGSVPRRDQLEAELVQRRRELREAGLVVDRDQGTGTHTSSLCLSTVRSSSGYRRRSTSLMRSCNVSAVSSSNTTTASWARI